jgi:hypothetical protein
VRIGLPTLLVCIAAIAGTQGTLSVPIVAAQNVAGLVSHRISGLTRSTAGHAHGDGGDNDGRPSADTR